jgi:hypothetical protein
MSANDKYNNNLSFPRVGHNYDSALEEKYREFYDEAMLHSNGNFPQEYLRSTIRKLARKDLELQEKERQLFTLHQSLSNEVLARQHKSYRRRDDYSNDRRHSENRDREYNPSRGRVTYRGRRNYRGDRRTYERSNERSDNRPYERSNERSNERSDNRPYERSKYEKYNPRSREERSEEPVTSHIQPKDQTQYSSDPPQQEETSHSSQQVEDGEYTSEDSRKDSRNTNESPKESNKIYRQSVDNNDHSDHPSKVLDYHTSDFMYGGDD